MKPHLLLTFLILITSCTTEPAAIDHTADAPTVQMQISDYIRRIFQDKNGTLWFGTNGDGVARYNGESLDYFISGDAVRGITETDNGDLWFATSRGVFRYDGKMFNNYTMGFGEGNNQVWSILKDKTGVLWFGTEGGVYRCDPNAIRIGVVMDSEIFTRFPLPTALETDSSVGVTSPKVVWDMIEDGVGNIWFATNGRGAYCYDPATETLTNLSEKEGLGNNFVQCIMEDKTGTLWFGTRYGGLDRYDPVTHTFTHFSEKEGLSNKFVWTMLEDKTLPAGSAAIWIGTAGGGLNRFDPTTGSFTHFTEKEGLALTHVQSLLHDKNGTLWVGCSGGLFRYDGKYFINVGRSGPWALLNAHPSLPSPHTRPQRNQSRRQSSG